MIFHNFKYVLIYSNYVQFYHFVEKCSTCIIKNNEMSSTKVAVVTGGNKGIGYAIVKGLCEKFPGKVYLTARDEDRGKAAVDNLKKLGFNPIFHQLDVNNQESINTFADHIKKTDGGIDVLVNNAGMAFKHNATEPVGVQAEDTIKTNYFGILNVCNILFPLLREHAQVINLSSALGHLSKIPSPELRSQLSSPTLTIEELNVLMQKFVESAKNDSIVADGWGNSTYVVSKVGVSALTIIQQRMFDAEGRDISVNSVHPGYVDTDMTSHKGPLTIEEGAYASLYLALELHNWKGKFVWRDAKLVDWFASTTPDIFS